MRLTVRVLPLSAHRWKAGSITSSIVGCFYGVNKIDSPEIISKFKINEITCASRTPTARVDFLIVLPICVASW